jgi:hypothetical protein
MATKARLHWFWRGGIAWLVGLGGILLLVLAANLLIPSRGATRRGGYIIIASTAFLATPLPGMVAYVLLTRRFGPPPPDGELHCRKCGHILRGLSEPRCPECGEAI